MNLNQKLIYGVAGFLIGIVFMAVAVVGYLNYPTDNSNRIELSQAVSKIEEGSVKKAEFSGSEAVLTLDTGKSLRVALNSEADREALLKAVHSRSIDNPSYRIEITEDRQKVFGF